MADLFGTALDFGASIGLGAFNNYWAEKLQERARYENYKYGEMAAENADKRTRALYEDFYSPQALLNQYQKAGLSPSLMYGGTPGQGGMSGAQGSGANGPGALYTPMSMIEGAQIANLMAQTEKTKAETKNVEKDTGLKELELAVKELETSQFKDTWQILNTRWQNDETGKQSSIFEMAEQYYSFEAFLKAVREDEATGKTNFQASTEAEIQQLRSIYESASRFNRDITILSSEQVNANFQISIVNALKNINYDNLNARAVASQLNQEIATNELTETQKEAWNNLIDRLGKKGSTMRDVVVVLGMILGNFASHTGIKLNVGGR